MPPEAQEHVEETTATPDAGGGPGSTPGDEGQPIGEQPGDGQAAGEEGTPADDGAGAPRSKGVERRIGQLTRKYRQSEREKQELAQRLEALEKRIGPEPEPVRPEPADFETQVEYEDALFDWRDAMRTHEASTSDTDSATSATPGEDNPAVQIVSELETELDALDDPEAVMKVMDDDWPCSTQMTEYIAGSEKRAQLAYHLATNPEISARIEKIRSPVLVARELVKIEEGLPESKTSASSEPAPPPPPGEPVSPSAIANVSDPDKLSPAQWRAWREQQIAEKAGN